MIRMDPDILSLLETMSFSYEDSATPNTGHSSILDIKSIREDFPILNKTMNGKKLIWLDNAATTQKPNRVIDAIHHYYTDENSNIHRGNYSLSQQATQKYEDTRKQVARFIHAASDKSIVFTKGTTEAINLVAYSFGKQFIQKGDEIIIGLFEHHSNILPWQRLSEEQGAILRVIPIHENGELMMEEYAKLLNSKTKLVAITHVSNVLGTVVPVHLITQMARQHGAYVLVDGAQGIPHFEVDVQSIDCDFYVFSGHKLFGPTGIGVLYAKEPILEKMPPYQMGGGMIKNVTMEKSEFMDSPYKFEAGTSNIAAVFGLSATLDYLDSIGMANIAAYEHDLMNYALTQLHSVPKIKIFGNPLHRASSVPFLLENYEPDDVGAYLNKEGIALRTGHHCAQPLMNFYGVKGMVRPSFAFYNTKEEVDSLTSALTKLVTG